jgi:hypothetical protein
MTTPLDMLQAAATTAENLEPGSMRAGDFVREAHASEDGEYKPPMIITDLATAGWVLIYDTETREPSLCNRNAVPTQLKELRPNGLPIFTMSKPKEGPWRGDIKCFLHADQPDRHELDAMGFPTCRKATLPNNYQAELHAEFKHRLEWSAVKADKERAKQDEDRLIQRELLDRLIKGDTSVVAHPVDIQDPTVVKGPFPGVPRYLCGKCEQNHVETTKIGRSHRKYEKVNDAT